MISEKDIGFLKDRLSESIKENLRLTDEINICQDNRRKTAVKLIEMQVDYENAVKDRNKLQLEIFSLNCEIMRLKSDISQAQVLLKCITDILTEWSVDNG